MKRFLYIISILLLFALCGCGNDKEFTVEGLIQGIGTRNLRIYYYDGNGLRTGVISALDGKFTLRGSTRKPAILAIATNQREFITAFCVENGDYVKLAYTFGKPSALRVDGNSINKSITDFVETAAVALDSGNYKDVNGAVGDFVRNNSDSPAAAVILALYYNGKEDPEGYAALMDELSPQAMQGGLTEGFLLPETLQPDEESRTIPVEPFSYFCMDDSLATFSAAADKGGSLIVLSVGSGAWKDSINKAVGSLPAKVRILNIGLQPDTAEWHSVLRESAQDKRVIPGWVPGSVSSPRLRRFAPVNALPFFVSTDSAGVITYRGNSLSEAVSKLK